MTELAPRRGGDERKVCFKLGSVWCMDAVTGLAEGRLGWTLVSERVDRFQAASRRPITPTVAHRRSTTRLLVSSLIVDAISQKGRLNGKSGKLHLLRTTFFSYRESAHISAATLVHRMIKFGDPISATGPLLPAIGKMPRCLPSAL